MKKSYTQHSSLKQLGLLDFRPNSVNIEPIGVTGITPDRFAIVVREHDIVWRFPIQWRAEELNTVRRLVDRFDWSIDFDEGVPVAVEEIYAAFEELLGSGDNYAQSNGEAA